MSQPSPDTSLISAQTRRYAQVIYPALHAKGIAWRGLKRFLWWKKNNFEILADYNISNTTVSENSALPGFLKVRWVLLGERQTTERRRGFPTSVTVVPSQARKLKNELGRWDIEVTDWLGYMVTVQIEPTEIIWVNQRRECVCVPGALTALLHTEPPMIIHSVRSHYQTDVQYL